MSHNNGRLDTGQKYTIAGETLSIPEFARKYNLNESVIRNRIKKGVNDENMFLPPEECIIPSSKVQRNNSLSWTVLPLTVTKSAAIVRNVYCRMILKKIAK